MATSLTGSGIQYNSGLTQSLPTCVIKTRATSFTTVDQSSAANTYTILTGGQIDMGTPSKTNNWYRITIETQGDDTSSTSGFGLGVERYTPSAGWVNVLQQGFHAQYDSDIGDCYRNGVALFYVPVHPTYGTENHQFRASVYTYNGSWRFNSSIGTDYRRDGWIQSHFEIMELDGDTVTSQGVTRF